MGYNMEADVIVRKGSPWIKTICPKCEYIIGHGDDVNYCCHCGTKVVFNNYEVVRDDGGRSIDYWKYSSWHIVTEEEMVNVRIKNVYLK